MAATAEAPSKTAHAPAGGPAAPRSWLANSANRSAAIGLVVIAIAFVAWFMVMSGRRKEAFAGRALDQARGIAEAGNLPQAAAELQKVITTYGGTRAGQEAVLTLNQVRLVNGQHELAAVGLQDYLKAGPSEEFRAPAQGLLGRAFENARRPADAATAYLAGADATDVPYLKAELLLDAGRALLLAGERDKAIAAYRRIVTEFPDSPSRTEAEVRLSELTGGLP